jgi:hypothetical protein
VPAGITAGILTFLSVKLGHQPAQKGAEPRIEVMLTSGCVIRLPAAFATCNLRQDLDVLERRLWC